MINLRTLQTERTIDVLRRKYPKYVWKYYAKGMYWYCEAGYAGWRSTCHCDDRCNHTPNLYFYPFSGIPELVATGY